VHGIITTWRYQPEDGLEQRIRGLNERLATEGATLPGHVAGYAVQVAPARMMMVNIYEDAAQAEIAAHALALVTLAVMGEHAEVIESQTGPAFAITTSA
jgi:hypothetical protein